MKKIKIVVAFLMSLMLAVSFVGCNKNKGNSSSGSSGDSTPTGPALENDPVTLLFEIDEGLGGYEFVAGCKKPDGSYDYAKMDIVLNNVYDGIKQFESQGKYKVGLHIYPEWYYKESGWNTNYTDGLQKWSDDFLYVMDFCEEKGIEVYLEFISSTIYVCQNGEEGSLPVVNINHGISNEERDVWGCACDFQSLRALKKKYPNTFTGLRMHELIGTENLAALGDPHACHIYEEDIYAIADEAKSLGVKLMWSDQTWGHCFTVASFASWLDRVTVVREKLGDDLILTFANNTSDIASVAAFGVYDLLVERFEGATMGYSNQAWFLDALILNDAKCESQAYIPVEIVAGFAQKAIERGAKFVQFEPYFHLFNYTRQAINGGTDYTRGGIAMNYVTPRYEEIQGDALDYSPRSELYRLADYLNSDTFAFSNVEDFFDESTGKIKADNVIDPPKMYQQTTVLLSGNKNVFVDKYNNNPDVWLTQNEHRYTERVIDPNAIAINRVSYTVGGFDDIITVTEKDGKNVGVIYNSISGKVWEDRNTFNDNIDGEFVGFTTANLIKTCSYRGKDTDEIIVFRKKGNIINLCLYTASVNADGYSELTGATASIIDDYFGSRQLPAENFVGVYGVRNSKAIGKKTFVRNIDGLIAVYSNGNSITVTGKRKITSASINQTLTLDGKVLCVTVGDTNLDINSADELIVAYESGNGSEAVAFEFERDNKLVLGEKIASVSNDKIESICTFGKFYYQNDNNL